MNNNKASSHSSFKLSPLPKLNQEGDESRRNSPANQQTGLSIKQELLDMGAHANLPQELIPVSNNYVKSISIHIILLINRQRLKPKHFTHISLPLAILLHLVVFLSYIFLCKSTVCCIYNQLKIFSLFSLI